MDRVADSQQKRVKIRAAPAPRQILSGALPVRWDGQSTLSPYIQWSDILDDPSAHGVQQFRLRAGTVRPAKIFVSSS